MNKCDLYEVMLHEQGKVPTGWKVFQWNCSPDDVPAGFIKLVGSVPVGVYERGPRKGSIKWGPRGKEPTESTHFVNSKEFDSFCEEWEKRTGSCYSCFGEHQVPNSWSRDRGTTYVPCKRCKDWSTPSVAPCSEPPRQLALIEEGE